MQAHLCKTFKRKLDARGVGRVKEAGITPETRVIDLSLLNVSL